MRNRVVLYFEVDSENEDDAYQDVQDWLAGNSPMPSDWTYDDFEFEERTHEIH